MKIQNKKIFLLISNLICAFGVLVYIFIAVKTLLQINSNYLFINITTSVIFLVPFGLSIFFALKSATNIPNFDAHKSKFWKTLIIIVSIICLAIFLFFFIYGIKGIISQVEAINGVKEGLIVSDTYTQDQLIAYFGKFLNRNIFSTVLGVVLFLNYLLSSVILFLNVTTISNASPYNSRECEWVCLSDTCWIPTTYIRNCNRSIITSCCFIIQSCIL